MLKELNVVCKILKVPCVEKVKTNEVNKKFNFKKQTVLESDSDDDIQDQKLKQKFDNNLQSDDSSSNGWSDDDPNPIHLDFDFNDRNFEADKKPVINRETLNLEDDVSSNSSQQSDQQTKLEKRKTIVSLKQNLKLVFIAFENKSQAK